MTHHKPQYTTEFHEVTDEWHHHTAAEGLPQEEHAGKVNTVVLTFVFFAIVSTISGTITASVLYFNRHITSLRQSAIENTKQAADANLYRGESEKALTAFTWADARAGTVQIPLDMAKERVIRKYAGK
jgi:hypothetical protein